MTPPAPPIYIVVSGLPASGKTTLARSIAPALGLRLLDKDTILEGLFDTLGVGDAAWRAALSRASDDVLFGAAVASPGAVLVSFWRRESLSRTAGTPTTPLSGLPGRLIEVFCRCDPEVAARRFVNRTRHRGHLDSATPFDEVLARFEALAPAYPIGLGELLTVATTGAVEVGPVLESIASIGSAE